jgi:predicted phage gp36 major capsid-like protein
MLDAYFPDSGWIRLSRETIAALQRFKASRGLPTWESVMAALLAAA